MPLVSGCPYIPNSSSNGAIFVRSISTTNEVPQHRRTFARSSSVHMASQIKTGSYDIYGIKKNTFKEEESVQTISSLFKTNSEKNFQSHELVKPSPTEHMVIEEDVIEFDKQIKSSLETINPHNRINSMINNSFHTKDDSSYDGVSVDQKGDNLMMNKSRSILRSAEQQIRIKKNKTYMKSVEQYLPFGKIACKKMNEQYHFDIPHKKNN